MLCFCIRHPRCISSRCSLVSWDLSAPTSIWNRICPRDLAKISTCCGDLDREVSVYPNPLSTPQTPLCCTPVFIIKLWRLATTECGVGGLFVFIGGAGMLSLQLDFCGVLNYEVGGSWTWFMGAGRNSGCEDTTAQFGRLGPLIPPPRRSKEADVWIGSLQPICWAKVGLCVCCWANWLLWWENESLTAVTAVLARHPGLCSSVADNRRNIDRSSPFRMKNFPTSCLNGFRLFIEFRRQEVVQIVSKMLACCCICIPCGVPGPHVWCVFNYLASHEKGLVRMILLPLAISLFYFLQPFCDCFTVSPLQNNR